MLRARNAVMWLGVAAASLGACHLVGGYDEAHFDGGQGGAAASTAGNGGAAQSTSTSAGGSGGAATVSSSSAGGAGGGGATPGPVTYSTCEIVDGSSSVIALTEHPVTALRVARGDAGYPWLGITMQAISGEPHSALQVLDTVGSGAAIASDCTARSDGEIAAITARNGGLSAVRYFRSTNGDFDIDNCVADTGGGGAGGSGLAPSCVPQQHHIGPPLPLRDVAIIDSSDGAFFVTSLGSGTMLEATLHAVGNGNIESPLMNGMTDSGVTADYAVRGLARDDGKFIAFLGVGSQADGTLRRAYATTIGGPVTLQEVSSASDMLLVERRGSGHLVAFTQSGPGGLEVRVAEVAPNALPTLVPADVPVSATLANSPAPDIVAATPVGVAWAEPGMDALDLVLVAPDGVQWQGDVQVDWMLGGGSVPTEVALIATPTFSADGAHLDVVWASPSSSFGGAAPCSVNEGSVRNLHRIMHAKIACTIAP